MQSEASFASGNHEDTIEDPQGEGRTVAEPTEDRMLRKILLVRKKRSEMHRHQDMRR